MKWSLLFALTLVLLCPVAQPDELSQEDNKIDTPAEPQEAVPLSDKIFEPENEPPVKAPKKPAPKRLPRRAKIPPRRIPPPLPPERPQSEVLESTTCKFICNDKKDQISGMTPLAHGISRESIQSYLNSLKNCEGTFNFDKTLGFIPAEDHESEVKFSFSLTKSRGPTSNGSGCEISYPNACGDRSVPLLKKMEAIGNVLYTGPERNRNWRINNHDVSMKVCQDAMLTLEKDCGLLKDSGDKRLNIIKDKVSRIVGAQKRENARRGRNYLEPKMLDCMFGFESWFAPTPPNYTGCQYRRKNFETDSKKFILGGWQSTAIGLGQVLIQTLCSAVKSHPQNYPGYERVASENMVCENPTTKKFLEPLFVRMYQDLDFQIKVSAEILNDKMADHPTYRIQETDENGTHLRKMTDGELRMVKGRFDSKDYVYRRSMASNGQPHFELVQNVKRTPGEEDELKKEKELGGIRDYDTDDQNHCLLPFYSACKEHLDSKTALEADKAELNRCRKGLGSR